MLSMLRVCPGSKGRDTVRGETEGEEGRRGEAGERDGKGRDEGEKAERGEMVVTRSSEIKGGGGGWERGREREDDSECETDGT
jgi:hypothetical protein